MSSHDFAEAQSAQVSGLRSNDCELIVRQQPIYSRVGVGKEKDRKPIDPPPVIQLKISQALDPAQNYFQSPFFFMFCNILGQPEPGSTSSNGPLLTGTVTSSLHRLKDPETQKDGAYFVFGDLSVKSEGSFRLQFHLYEKRNDAVYHMASVTSKTFVVHSTKNFPGMNESTRLTRSFGDQGVRLRIRKEPRSLLRKRGPASDDYLPRQYAKRAKEQEEEVEPQGVNKHREGEQIGSAQMLQHGTAGHTMQKQARQYSQLPSSSLNSYVDENQSRRPRTNSDQSRQQMSVQSSDFAHNESLANTQWDRRSITEMPPPAFSTPQFTPQAQMQSYDYSSNYAHSPQLVTTPVRDQYFAARLSNTHIHGSPQQSSPAQFELNNQRSPPNFYTPQANPQFPHPIHSPPVPILTNPSPIAHRKSTGYNNIEYASRPHVAMTSVNSMPPPPPPELAMGRSNMIPGYLPYNRRDDFDALHSGEQSLSSGITQFPGHFDHLGSRGQSPAVTTTAPGMGNY